MENPQTTAAEAGSMAGGQSPVAKFAGINDPAIREFVSSIPHDFQQTAAILAGAKFFAPDRVLQNRLALASKAHSFHDGAQTNSQRVQESISRLQEPETLVLVATHQPNLFSYGGIFKKVILLEALKSEVERLSGGQVSIVNLFLVVDHDFLDETWIRVAQLPSLQSSDGIMDLRLPIKESQRWKMVCNVMPPAHSVLSHWKSQLKNWIRSNSLTIAERRELFGNLEDLWSEYEAAYADARSYSDLNAFFMSRIVNARWNYSTVFVRLSELSQIFADGFTFLLANFRKYSEGLRRAERVCMAHGIDTGISASSHLHAPLWLHCSCGSKTSPRLRAIGREMALEGSCISCGKQLQLGLGDADHIDIKESAGLLSPKAIPIPLLLAREIGISGYASGTGGLGYLVDGQVIAKELGIKLPTTLLWASKDNYIGIGQREAAAVSSRLNDPIVSAIAALNGRHQRLENLIRPLLQERAAAVGTPGAMKDVLDRIFALKQQQREIRSELSGLTKVRNILTLSPCFVDYAVNFGVEHSEMKWRKHLVERGSLAGSVMMQAASVAAAS
ncbi:MAG: hypothetical protein ABI361_10780 [Nitrososphaera sp.]|jgi:hypothetical protein